MIRRAAFALLALVVSLPASGQVDFERVDTFVSSRGVQVPATFVYPRAAGGARFPLVVMAHGHGGSRHENGAFDRVAESLARRGVAAIAVDFPGCGDSSEPFTGNNLTNMIADVLAARDYAVRQPQVDAGRVGLFGWSMGGRIAMMLADRNDEFDAIATWAPAAQPGAGSMIGFLGGPEAFEAARAQAARDGYFPFTTRWGQDQQLGERFFTDMQNSAPLEPLAKFTGALLVLYGDRDDVVLPEVAESAVAAARQAVKVVRYVVKGADHGLGVFSDEPNYTDQAVNETVGFLVDHL